MLKEKFYSLYETFRTSLEQNIYYCDTLCEILDKQLPKTNKILKKK